MPGPKNGMTLMTEKIYRHLEARYNTTLFDVGGGFHRAGRRWTVRKAINSAAAGIAMRRHSGSPSHAYLVLNSHGGLRYNLWHLRAAKKKRCRIVLHHHVWSYLSQHDSRMQTIVDTAGPDAVHVVACPEMAGALRSQYGDAMRFAYMTPAIMDLAGPPGADAEPLVENDPHAPFRLGMLSNLTLEKGTDDAIRVLDRLREAGENVTLTLAGPLRDAAVRSAVDSARVRCGDSLRCVGPIYGAEKEAFFRELDAFIFPTRYRNESWGIVLNEALMAGVPVITRDLGCIRYLVDNAGTVVETSREDFASEATPILQHWIRDRAEHRRARETAMARGESLRSQASAQLARFVDAFETDDWPTASL